MTTAELREVAHANMDANTRHIAFELVRVYALIRSRQTRAAAEALAVVVGRLGR